MKTYDKIKESLDSRFKDRAHRYIRKGSVIDLINSSIAQEMEDAYIEIENARNPHIYTNMSGDNIDRLGYMVNVPRQNNEDDDTYLYRIMNWTNLKAASNNTAINDSLLNLEYASNAQFFPGTYGAGTGTVYVIPNKYEDTIINKALDEAKTRIKDVVDPSAYIEYIVPNVIPVKFLVQVCSVVGDMDYIKASAESQIKDYVNAIAPGEYLIISNINKIGLAIDNVDYFNVSMTYINGGSNANIRFLQQIDTKYIFDKVIWEEVTV